MSSACGASPRKPSTASTMACTMRGGRLAATRLHDLGDALGAELFVGRVERLVDAVGAEHEDVAGAELEHDLVVRHAGERSERQARQLDRQAAASAVLLSVYGSPELAIVSVRRLRSKYA